MKLVALSQRAAKRDYVDISVGLQSGLTLRELLDLMKRKYAGVDYSEYHFVRSLTFFDDVEKDPMPYMFAPLSWEAVRSFLCEEVRRLAQ